MDAALPVSRLDRSDHTAFIHNNTLFVWGGYQVSCLPVQVGSINETASGLNSGTNCFHLDLVYLLILLQPAPSCDQNQVIEDPLEGGEGVVCMSFAAH